MSMSKNTVFLLICILLSLPKRYTHIILCDFLHVLKDISIVILNKISCISISCIQQPILYTFNKLITILYQKDMTSKIRES